MYLTNWVLLVTILSYNLRGDLVPSEVQLDNPYDESMTREECTKFGIQQSKNNPLIVHFTCKEEYISKDIAT